MVSFLSDIYRESRYLETIADLDLQARLLGLTANLVNIDNRGIPSFRIANGKDGLAFIDLLEELKIRNANTDQLLSTSLNRFMGLFQRHEIARIQQQLSGLRGRKCLFKFTKAKYVDAILNGAVRFKTASSYNDEGFNIAIRDDELNIDHILRGIRVQTRDGVTIPVNNYRITANAAGDYYVSCFSIDFDLKLFALFECDCCVVISNADKFVDSVILKYEATYPEFYVGFGAVEYVDPYRQLSAKRPIEFRKSCNFSYEKEYRFVSFPSKLGEDLAPVQTLNIDPAEIDFHILRMTE
jgi:hypothetical protein